MPEQTAWFVSGPDGRIYYTSASYSETSSIERFEKSLQMKFRDTSYTCKEFRLVPVEGDGT